MYTYLLYLGVAFLAWIAVFIDSKLFDRKTAKITYVKIIVLCLLLVYVSQKFILNTNIVSNNNIENIIGKKTTFLPDIGESMISGTANF